MKFLFLGFKPSKALSQKILNLQWQFEMVEQLPTQLRSGEVLLASLEWIPKVPAHPMWREKGSYTVGILKDATQNPYIQKSEMDDFWIEKGLEDQLPLSLFRLVSFLSKGAEKIYALDRFAESLIKKFEEDLELARALQHAFLPENIPLFPGIHFTTRFLPSQGAGGDYFDIFILEKDKEVGILLHHSSQHALTAKLLSELLKLQIHELKGQFPSSSSFISHLLSSFPQEEQKKVALFFGKLERKTLSFQYTEHGKSFFEVIREQKGIGPQTQLLPGDKVVLGTFGLAEVLERDPSRWHKLIGSELPLTDLQSEILAWEHEALQSKPRMQDLVLILFEIDPKALFLSKI